MYIQFFFSRLLELFGGELDVCRSEDDRVGSGAPKGRQWIVELSTIKHNGMLLDTLFYLCL